MRNKENLAASAVSGGIGGFSVVLVGYPFDLVKVRLQTSAKQTSLSNIITSIWKTRGFLGFYQGATAPFLAVSPIFALNFYGYDLGKRLYTKIFRDHSPMAVSSAGSFFSALQTALIIIPAERIKVQLQMPRAAGVDLGVLQISRDLWSGGGLKSFFRGSAATLGRDIPGLMIFFTSYEAYKQRLCSSEKDTAGILLAGGLAGMTSWMFSLPFDVLKSRLQSAPPAQISESFPTLSLLTRMIRHEGFFSLYRGIVPVMMRAFPANAACFLAYETAYKFISDTFYLK